MVVHEVQGQEIGHHTCASHHVHFVDDQEFNPLAYAEQFEDSDPSKGQSSEVLLRKARMLLRQNLGKILSFAVKCINCLKKKPM
jgi:transcription elongation factor SPT6